MSSGNILEKHHLSDNSFRRNKIKECLWLYKLLKTSLGPISMDKMIIDNLGNVTITNDGASILKRIETSDPISRILIELSLQQDSEIGDGTTSIIIITSNTIATPTNSTTTKIIMIESYIVHRLFFVEIKDIDISGCI